MDTRTMALPATKLVRDLFAELLDRDVTVAPDAPVECDAQHPAMVAVYVDDTVTIRAVVVADLPLTAYAGAALGLVPKVGAEAALEDGVLGPNLVDNAREVLNILASVFNQPGSAHVRMHEDHPPGSVLPAHVAAGAGTLGQRVDVSVDITGYGTGRLSLVLV